MGTDKLNQLEESLAHQEREINDLSDMVVQQGNEIARLKKHILKLEDKIETIETDKNGGGHEDIADQKPPHY